MAFKDALAQPASDSVTTRTACPEEYRHDPATVPACTADRNVADVEEAMRDVVDPELGINVVDLGLVYGITVDDAANAVLDMTLTSAACPLTDVIEDQTDQALEGLVNDVPHQLGVDAAVGPRQDHRGRPRAAARPRLQRLSQHHPRS